MDSKQMLLSALGVGVGVGVGLGLASGQAVGKWAGGNSSSNNAVTADKMEKEILRQVVDGRESKITFDDEQTRVLLTSAAYVHLKHFDASKYTRNLSPASRAILLSGPAELYQQMLAKALAHFFDAKLLLLDVNDFALKIQSKYGSGNTESSVIAGGTLRRQSSGVDIKSSSMEGSSNPPKLRRNSSAAANISNLASSSNQAPLKRSSSWSFDEKLLVQSLYKVMCKTIKSIKVLAYVSKANPIVLYLRDVENFLFRSQRTYNLFQKLLQKLSGPVLILGSRIVDLSSEDAQEIDEKLSAVFPYNIDIRPPEDETHLVSWKSQLERDMNMIQTQDNRNHIMEVLSENDLICDDLESISFEDTKVLSNYIEEIVVSALSYHLMNNKDPEYRNGKLVISSISLSHGFSLFREGKAGGREKLKQKTKEESSKEVKAESIKPETKTESVTTVSSKEEPEKEAKAEKVTPKAPEVAPDNEFEKRIRPEVIPAEEINVTFKDIGALDEIKESLQELVMLPLRRPDLFTGGLLKPCRGILLFGPPGTGKTMLAKAIAKEAGASFINVSMSTITSKWFGEDEKNVRALFTLASKVSPTIIFVDEVDSMLGQRTRVGEHEAMRKIKNEFMSHWDGLMTKPGERILVLAATNRPFDLDEAIIRRFERRIMVGLPAVENREKILRTLLAKEKVDENLDYKELAMMTEGYTGSDLKNLCTTAAYRPVRELIQQERIKDTVRNNISLRLFLYTSIFILVLTDCEKKKQREPTKAGEEDEGKEERVITLRPLNRQDFKEAKNQVAASFAAEGAGMGELKQWNELYGEGGSRKKEQLTYFL
ncbi:F22C12.12 [Arabidopsis thaliana]|uniref:F22C12.12 n=1 Tax=Arabidopsis thaliana TaxID=3702 RepID=Q9SH62_ARATH|nr:F22C12.12 [Arabidopsis thaliana]